MIDRIAYAFTPSRWKGRSLVIVSVGFVVVAALTIVQRALVADGAIGWTITAIHAAVVIVVVPLLIGRTVREWRARSADRSAGVGHRVARGGDGGAAPSGQ